MNTELDALATRLYVTIDDLLIDHPEWRPERPEIGIAPKLTDAELITLAVIQALLGYTSEARFWPRQRAPAWLVPVSSPTPGLQQAGSATRRATMQHVIAALARDCPSWNDDLWLVDSTPRSNAAAAVKR